MHNRPLSVKERFESFVCGLCVEVTGGWGWGRAIPEKVTETNDARIEGQCILCWLSLLYLFLCQCEELAASSSWESSHPSLVFLHIYSAQQLLLLFHMHTQALTAFIHQDPDSKLYAPRSCTVVSCHWYRMITEHTSVIIRILPCWLLTSTNISLPNNWDSICIFGNAIKSSFAHVHSFLL